MVECVVDILKDIFITKTQENVKHLYMAVVEVSFYEIFF